MNDSRSIKRLGHISPIEEMRNAYKILVGKPERKREFRRYKRRLGLLSVIILEKLTCKDVNCIDFC
jgi:hypothetical protein